MKKKLMIIGSAFVAVMGIVILIIAFRKKEWRFDDNYFSGVSGTSMLGFIGKTKPPFKPNQPVVITQDAGATYPEYDGETTVDAVYEMESGDWIVEVAKNRIGDTPVNGGFIKG